MFRIDRSQVNITKSLDLRAILAPIRETPEPEPEEERDEKLEASAPEPEPKPPDTSFIDEAMEELRCREEELRRREAEFERLSAEKQSEAQELVVRAAREAQEKLEAAETLAVEIKSKAWREGYDEGQRAASEELEEKLREDEERLKGLLEEISAEREHMFDGLEGDAIALVLDIARKIIDKAVLGDEELFVSMAGRAVRELRSKSPVTLRVSPEVCESFFPGGKTDFHIGDKTITASILPDAELEGSALVAETEEEMIDAGPATQLRLISLKFSETLESADNSPPPAARNPWPRADERT